MYRVSLPDGDAVTDGECRECATSLGEVIDALTDLGQGRRGAYRIDDQHGRQGTH